MCSRKFMREKIVNMSIYFCVAQVRLLQVMLMDESAKLTVLIEVAAASEVAAVGAGFLNGGPPMSSVCAPIQRLAEPAPIEFKMRCDFATRTTNPQGAIGPKFPDSAGLLHNFQEPWANEAFQAIRSVAVLSQAKGPLGI
jgi:hypothetical protein